MEEGCSCSLWKELSLSKGATTTAQEIVERSKNNHLGLQEEVTHAEVESFVRSDCEPLLVIEINEFAEEEAKTDALELHSIERGSANYLGHRVALPPLKSRELWKQLHER